MRVLITGAGGMLGADIVKTLAEKHELILLDNKPLPQSTEKNARFLKIDITDADNVYKEITSINPDIVIHAAAYTDVDGAENDRDLAYSINAIGTRNIALACQRFDTVMFYVSTDYVFDGEKREPYIEYDSPNPQGVYAKSKYQGELYVQQLLNKYYVVRSSGLYGKNGRNFVSAILELAKEKDELKVVSNQYTSPTYTKDLARAIGYLMDKQLYGIWHITNSGDCSWHEFAGQIVKNTRIEKKVSEISTGTLKRPARRPEYSVLDNYLWRLNGFPVLRNWRDALNEFMRGEL